MRFGVCAPFSEAVLLAQMGYDYVEINATDTAALSDADFEALCAENAAAPIHAEAANCLFPGRIRLTGEGVDAAEIEGYIEHTFSRLARLGIQIAVFGSGGSRRVPDNFSFDTAFQQLAQIGRLLGDIGQKHGVTVALEPLNRAETNIINDQLEGLRLVEAAAHPHFKLLCDYYHLALQGNATADVAACGKALVHAHIANPEGRAPMTAGDRADYRAFFNALSAAGYNGRVSLECNTADKCAQWPQALACLRTYS